MSDSLRFNHVEWHRRIKRWLEDNCSEAIVLEFDEASIDADALCYTAQTEDGFAPSLTKAARKAAQETLGPAVNLVLDKSKLELRVWKPSAGDAALLMQTFRWRTLAAMRRVWPRWIAVLVLAVSFLLLCYSSSALHAHWKDWESPTETMFHSLFAYCIWIGDRLTGSASVTHAHEL